MVPPEPVELFAQSNERPKEKICNFLCSCVLKLLPIKIRSKRLPDNAIPLEHDLAVDIENKSNAKADLPRSLSCCCWRTRVREADAQRARHRQVTDETFAGRVHGDEDRRPRPILLHPRDLWNPDQHPPLGPPEIGSAPARDELKHALSVFCWCFLLESENLKIFLSQFFPLFGTKNLEV
jgi:hypothetical protein